jgi:hypothetical protein
MRLITMDESCSSIAREILGKTLTLAVQQTQQEMSLPDFQLGQCIQSLLGDQKC